MLILCSNASTFDVNQTNPAPDSKVSNTECYRIAGYVYLFIYSISMCACVQMQTHLQLLTSSWLVLLHRKWQLVPSLKQERKILM